MKPKLFQQLSIHNKPCITAIWLPLSLLFVVQDLPSSHYRKGKNEGRYTVLTIMTNLFHLEVSICTKYNMKLRSVYHSIGLVHIYTLSIILTLSGMQDVIVILLECSLQHIMIRTIRISPTNSSATTTETTYTQICTVMVSAAKAIKQFIHLHAWLCVMYVLLLSYILVGNEGDGRIIIII